VARRYFVDELPPVGDAVLDGDVAHHLGTVLRVRPGEALLLGDGKGTQCRATVARVGSGKVALRVEAPTAVAPPTFLLHLAFAPPKWTRAEWLFEHGTEAGVAVFWPLWTERSRPQGHRQDRWQKLVRAAAGQCDRAHLPTVEPVTELAAFLRGDLPQARFVGDAGAAPAPTEIATNAVLLVGPEGGFTDAERAAIAAAGFVAIGLGPHVLRTETAALAGATVLALAAMRAGRS
jgi:16S rRNA (uracil1498-N3)-methyltransferase